MRSTLSTLTAALFLFACGGSAPPVTVVGAEADIRALTGTWFGDYSSVLTGRSGSVSFELRATGDSAFGSVVMTPRGAGGPLQPWRDPRMASASMSNELTIRFVRVFGGSVSGTLTPYADPTTGTRLLTRFEGRIAGDTISGTFTTEPTSGSNGPTGRWRVVRSAGPANAH